MVLAQLEIVVANMKKNQPALMGPIFIKFCPFFKVYIEYINKYDAAVAHYEKLEKKNAKFRDMLVNPQLLVECDGLNLSALLILPVQRLPVRDNLFL